MLRLSARQEKRPSTLRLVSNLVREDLRTRNTQREHHRRSEWNFFDGLRSERISQWYLACGENSQKNLLSGSLSFLIAEIVGVLIVGTLADRYGRKLMLLMCLYIPVVCNDEGHLSFKAAIHLALRLARSLHHYLQSVPHSSLAGGISQSSNRESRFHCC